MSLTSFFTIVCFFEIDVLVCILFPVQFSKIMCTSAVLIYITKYFPLRQMFFYFFLHFFYFAGLFGTTGAAFSAAAGAAFSAPAAAGAAF